MTMFRQDFLWGGDISAAQCEGAYNVGGKSPVYRDYLLGGNKNEKRSAYYKDENGEGNTGYYTDTCEKKILQLHRRTDAYFLNSYEARWIF